MPRGELRSFDSVVLNGAGDGTVKVGPASARERWFPTTAAVNVNANPTNEAMCRIYVGDANTMRLIDTSVSGSSGDSTSKIEGKTVRSSEYVWAVWTGGDAGQRATLTVTGEREV